MRVTASQRDYKGPRKRAQIKVGNSGCARSHSEQDNAVSGNGDGSDKWRSEVDYESHVPHILVGGCRGFHAPRKDCEKLSAKVQNGSAASKSQKEIWRKMLMTNSEHRGFISVADVNLIFHPEISAAEPDWV